MFYRDSISRGAKLLGKTIWVQFRNKIHNLKQVFSIDWSTYHEKVDQYAINFLTPYSMFTMTAVNVWRIGHIIGNGDTSYTINHTRYWLRSSMFNINEWQITMIATLLWISYCIVGFNLLIGKYINLECWGVSIDLLIFATAVLLHRGYDIEQVFTFCENSNAITCFTAIILLCREWDIW